MTNDDIRSLTVIALRDAIAAGDLTAEQATLAAIEQAGRFKDEYKLFVTFTPERALADARAADAARAAGKPLGPLHGVPITVKDNIDVAGVKTSAGSLVLAHRMPTEDATVVAKLKAAGAILTLGQTNMHEMAAAPEPASRSRSDMPRWGPTRAVQCAVRPACAVWSA
ncbi:MAG: amidase family protein [Chloroflexi bacterium]|nr:amidase family protein [Chloroflexota bacterium]